MDYKKIFLWPGTQVFLISLLAFLFIPNAVNLLSFSGDLFLQGDVWRFITFPFTHLNLQHLFENLVALGVTSLLAYEVGIRGKQFTYVFLGASLLLALTTFLFMPLIVIAGASAGIFALLGSITRKGTEFISQWLFVPLISSSVFVKLFISFFSMSWREALYPQFLLHFLGFIYGIIIFSVIIYYRSNNVKKILQVSN
jgi:membrane associated rhomboid family serine protease